MRKRTGAMLCPACRKLINVDADRCPYCGQLRPGLWGWMPAIQRLFGQQLDLVRIIVAVCVVTYVISLIIDPPRIVTAGLGGLLAPSSRALYLLGMTGGIATHLGHWWTVLTAIYLHGGLLHIGFNLIWVWQLGPVVESTFGPARFFVLWSASGAGGFFLSNMFGAPPSIGASGAIFGLLGSLIAYGRRSASSLDALVTRQMIRWAVILFIFGFLMPGINNIAHAGGFGAGYLIADAMARSGTRSEGRGAQVLALLLLVATAGSFFLSVTRMLPLFH